MSDFNQYYTEKEQSRRPAVTKSELVAKYNDHVSQIESIAKRYVERARRSPPRNYSWITVSFHKKVVWPIYESDFNYQLCLGCDGLIYAVYEHDIAEEYGLMKRMEPGSTALDSVVMKDINRLAELIEHLKSKEFIAMFNATEKAVDRERTIDPSLMPGKPKSLLKRIIDASIPTLLVVFCIFIAATIFASYLYGKYVGW